MSRQGQTLVLFASVAFLIGLDASAAPQGDATGGLLAGLPGLKSFTAARQSSHDPTGGNADGRQDWPIQAGETRTMAKIKGAGAITHIWVTIASKDANHLRNLVLRMYWDGERSPSVDCPIGDFFGLGYDRYYQYDCLPIQIGTNHGLNCFWHMPFSHGALVTVTNDGPVACGAFYYYVDYQQYKRLPKHTGRFHAQYRQQYPCAPGQNYVFLEVKGRGHYVGCNLSIHNRADGWWGEGDDMIYVDGETTPSLHGTGSEDYFCGAWCYGEPFSDLFIGCPLIDGRHTKNALWNVYRYHISDPIPFTKSIKVTIEHGHANDRRDDFSSVAYWYQTEPHVPFPALPKPEDRLPPEATTYTEEGATEAEDLIGLFQGEGVTVQDLSSFADKWSGDKHLWFRPNEPATYSAIMPIAPGEAGEFTMELWYTLAPDYGICELWINGERVTQNDLFRAAGVGGGKIDLPVTINEGENTIELKVIGKNPSSTGFYAGIDCFRLTPRQ